jgi:hypothetical protein
MGTSLSWLVVESVDADAIARALAVKRTGTTGPLSDMPLAGRTLDDGRFLIVASGVDHPAFKHDKLTALSKIAPITFCELEEHVMWSSVERWKHGRKSWSVAHRGEDSPLDLRTVGNVPTEFTELRTDVFARQEAEGGVSAGVDLIFDLPIDFARQQTALHPNDTLFDEPDFERLDAGWAERWRGMPFLAKLAIWIAAVFLLAYLAGALFRAIAAQISG